MATSWCGFVFANTNTVKRHCCTIQVIALYTDFFSLILWEDTAGRAIPGLMYIFCYAKTRSMAEVTLEFSVVKSLTMVKKVDKVYYGKSNLFTLTLLQCFHDSSVTIKRQVGDKRNLSKSQFL